MGFAERRVFGGMKTKILCICAKGRNRSRYLAGYLRRKGYSTKFGGIDVKDEEIGTYGEIWKTRPINKKDVDWADVIIVVRKRLAPVLKKKFKIKGKRVIVLDVTDSKRLAVLEDKSLAELDYLTFQKKWTSPKLRKAIKEHLPLKKK